MSINRRRRVCIGIITYLRPQGLRRLLDSLERQAFIENERPELDIVVVDNDAAGSAASICRDFTPAFGKIHYAVEPSRGIPYARNRVCRLARELGHELLAFIDDDETAAPQWLDKLL